MKKTLGIILICLLWSNIGSAKDLTGTKLFCPVSIDDDVKWRKYFAFHFISEEKVKYYSIVPEIKWDVRQKESEYIVDPTTIQIEYPVSAYINRETLRLSSWQKPCMVMDKDWSPELEFNNILEKMLEEQESKNKL